MKITEVVIAPKESKDTISSGTISSAIKGQPAQDIVSDNFEVFKDLVMIDVTQSSDGDRVWLEI